MPIFGLIAGAGAAIGGLITGFGSFLASGTFLAGVTKSVIALGIQLAVQAAFPPVSGAAAQTVSGAELSITYGENQPRIVRCGRFGVRGHFVYANGSGEANKNHDQVFVLSHYFTTALDQVSIDGETVTLGASEGDLGRPVTSGDYAGLIWVQYYDGRQTQADPLLVADANPSGRWTADHVGTGISYARVRFRFDNEKQTRPAEVFFEGRGAPLYDPAQDSTIGGDGPHRWNDVSTHEFDERPTLAAYNYCRGFAVNGDLFCGMGLPASVLPLGDWLIANAICGEAVSYGQRYRAAIGFNCMAEHGTNLDAAMAACGGVLVQAVDGMWPVVGAEQPVIATITDDDLVESAGWEYDRHRPLAERVYQISGTYPEPDNQWQPTAYADANDPTAPGIDRSGRAVTIDHATIPYRAQAEQLSAQAISENAFEATATVTVHPKWRWLKPGQWVELAIEGRAARVMRIVDMTRASLQSDGPRNVTLLLEERSADIYQSVGVTLPPVVVPPGAPVYQEELAGFDVDPAFSTGDQGAVQAAMLARWLPPTDPTVTGVLLQWWRTADPTQIFETRVSRDVTVRLLTEGVVGLTEYQVRHTLLTDPPRPVSPSATIPVTTEASPSQDITVELQNLGAGPYGALEAALRRIDILAAQIEVQGGNLAVDMSDQFLERLVVERRAGEALARVITETAARISGDAALASQIQAVQAGLGDVLAQGLLSISASASPDLGADAEVLFAARAAAGGNAAEAAIGLTATAGPGGVSSDVLFKASSRVLFIGDDGSIKGAMLVDGNGEFIVDKLRATNGVLETVATPSNTLKIGVLAPGVEGLELVH